MGILAILAGLSTRVIFHFVEQGAIAPINLAFGVIPLLLLILFTIILRKKYYLFPCSVVPNFRVVS